MRIWDLHHKDIIWRQYQYISKDANMSPEERKHLDWQFGNLQRDLVNAPLFDITDIARDFALQDFDWNRDDLPRMVMPYDIMWAEWLMPKLFIVNKVPQRPASFLRKARVGALMTQREIPETPVGLHMAYVKAMEIIPPWSIKTEEEKMAITNKVCASLLEEGIIEQGDLERNVHWEVALKVYLQPNNKKCTNVMNVIVCLDSDGYLVSKTHNMKVSEGYSPERGDHTVFLWAVALLNAMNIEEVEIKEPPTLSRKHRKRGAVKHVFKTLQIRRPKRVKRLNGDLPDQDTQQRRHLVRGHFKHYTEESPLFGKYVGSWWWGSQYRGNEEIGTVYKEYEVMADEVASN